MLTHHRRPVCLSLISTDLPICNDVETVATLYQKEDDRFHLLLTEPVENTRDLLAASHETVIASPLVTTSRLLWLEFSPYRATLTVQGNGLSYRHLWEQGIYGLSRYWLHSEPMPQGGQIRLRNFTRSLTLEGKPLPTFLRIDYELWSERFSLGHYILSLEIQH
jgi:hypothetical protein